MSSAVGSHHSLLNQATGFNRHPAAPSAPPMIEIVAAGFFCLTQEQTVILFQTMTPAAPANNRHAINQRKGNPISHAERAILDFLSCKLAKQGRSPWRGCWKSSSGYPRSTSQVWLAANCQLLIAFLRRFRHYLCRWLQPLANRPLHHRWRSLIQLDEPFVEFRQCQFPLALEQTLQSCIGYNIGRHCVFH
jgi:hypothetical protein